MKIKKEEWFYLPNILTEFRLVTFPIPVLLIAYGHDLAALILVVVGVITDIADGYLARRLNQVSELGKILDPVADKLAIGSLVIALYLFKDFPLWATAVIIGRDLFILIASLLSLRKAEPTPTSNFFGKLTALAWTLLIISYLTPLVVVQKILLIVAPAMVPISALLYLYQFRYTGKFTGSPRSRG